MVFLLGGGGLEIVSLEFFGVGRGGAWGNFCLWKVNVGLKI